MTVTSVQAHVADEAERRAALNPEESFLVQAPAGSGKTELLVLRYLALLPTVEEPEQVLAITFTRKATAEMRLRVLAALEAARRQMPVAANEHERDVQRLALAALAHGEARGWDLLKQPQRLNIQTIDSLALSIAYQVPLLSRLGGQLNPTEKAMPLYALAAERTLSHLGSATHPELAGALSEILRLRDANLGDCESLIAGMLSRRDQWLLVLPGMMLQNPPWQELRTKLEAPFRREHERLIAQLKQHFHDEVLFAELLALAEVACANGADKLQPLQGLTCCDDLTDVTHWCALSELLLTKDDSWRRSLTKNIGFLPEDRQAKDRLLAILRSISSEELRMLLAQARKIPPAAYSAEEWRTVRNIFIVLRHAMAELRVIFAEQGVIDFAEAGIAARVALEEPHVLMRLDAQIRHLLVDEFQDTSRPHFALLRSLLEGWQPGDGRTCFFVGDPMQSIYLFRDAESRLFGQVREHGMEAGNALISLQTLQLSTNFRSIPAIVNPLNGIFGSVFGAGADTEVQHAPSISSKRERHPGEDAVHLHVRALEKSALFSEEAEAAEADELFSIIRQHWGAVEEAQRNGGKYRIAVLARARTHLAAIIDKLQREHIPFRGVKIDLLRDRPEILDLLSLLRALLHPADRIAWLAVLRAPWCGLTIPALHAISGDLSAAETDLAMPSLIRLHSDRLDPESRRRAFHVLSILERAQAAYADGALGSAPGGLALWLERTWHALGAPSFLSAEALANCDALFTTLAEMPASSFGTLDESLNQNLEELFAEPAPGTSEDCGVQLMTIHSAKGLEFEVVLVPQLNRPGKQDDPPLFHWLVRRRADSAEDELMLAPIGYKHGDKPRLYDWVGRKVTRRAREEEKRLLYVACSRAIRELHLFAAVQRKDNGEPGRPRQGSLLAAGSEGLDQRVAVALQARSASKVVPISASPSGGNGTVIALAASAQVRAPQLLRRLPDAYFAGATGEAPQPSMQRAVVPSFTEEAPGPRLARIEGIVLHSLLEQAAAGTSGQHPHWERLTNALLRQYGLSHKDASAARSAVLKGIQNTLDHEQGRWLLMNRGATRDKTWSEQSWSSMKGGLLLRQRPDLVFLGGSSPGAEGTEYLWIVDYKTAPLPEGKDRDSFLAASREQYRNQLEQYSDLFRTLPQLGAQKPREHRLAIYHPMLPWLDWWPA